MKTRITAVAMVACIIVCAACSQSKNGDKGGQMPPAMGSMRTQQSVAAVSDSAKQSATRTVTGTVKSIVGNEVTLAITPERAAQGGFGGGMQRQQRELPDGEKATEKPQRAEFTDAAKQPSAEDKERPQQKADKQTAETYLLPVGMKMGSKDYSSITAGNTLKIYFGSHPEDGSEIIIAVEVMGGRR